MQKDNL